MTATVTTAIPPRTPIRCHCGQVLAWRLAKSQVIVPVIAANVQDESVGTVRIRCHGCGGRIRVTVVEVVA